MDLLPDNAQPSSKPPPGPPPLPDIDESPRAHLVLDVIPLDPPPPQFVPFDAKVLVISNGDIVSHDARLNTDGEALYRFLLSQYLQAPPYYQLHCRGTHTETSTRTPRTPLGRGHSGVERDEQYTKTITDFDFYINVHPSLPASFTSGNDSCGLIHWSVSDSEPVYRGRMVREIELPSGGGKREATWSESRQYDEWGSGRVTLGLPPWVSRDNSNQFCDVDSAVALRSSKSLRQWADEYCASPKLLKEFMYEKVLYGWNMKQFEEAVRATIFSTYRRDGSITISFDIKNSKVYVRPKNILSRILSNELLKTLLTIFFIYWPLIWLYKHFYAGGRWKVCGGAYSFRREVTEDGPETMGKRKKMIGLQEGEWLEKWGNVIKHSVDRHYRSSEPISTLPSK
ncbi:hypothetical protein M378DRAFT_166144 [Amanita muscaria Koide BX008]|uniref:Uncharacterized protein n=1 Tax=Amanita muscaria (strain Koide BX008) TaxID=946122 RepID=A0A0C2X028_AMAMK|nr:hypothetical protein M378DRAFT_166144 [Amanita muscaria Koide BX008]